MSVRPHSLHTLAASAPWLAPPESLRHVRRLAAAGLGGALVMLAAVLLWRRAAGALAEPLSPGFAFGAGLMLALLTMGLRATMLWSGASWGLDRARLKAWIDTSLLVVVIGALLWLPGMRFSAVLLFWLPVLTEESTAWLIAKRPKLAHGLRARRQFHPPSDTPPPITPALRETTPSPTMGPSELSDDLVQQLSRTQTATADTLEGMARAVLVEGQRTAYLHIAFCPPFETTPMLEFEQTEGPEARIKIGQLLPYGARLDVRTDEPGPARVTVAFTARGSGVGGRGSGGSIHRSETDNRTPDHDSRHPTPGP